MSTLTICLIIFVLTIIGYCSNLYSLATISMVSMAALVLTGCLSPNDALTYFANNNVIMIAGMCVVAAGFNRTQFCTNMANGIAKMAKGNLTKMMFGYILIGTLLSQFIQSPVVVFGIVAPMLMASAESMGLKPSKVMFSLGVITVITCCTLPVGAGATVAAELNGYLESYGYTEHMVGVMDPMKGRLPLLIVAVLYCVFISPKLAPDEPVVPTIEAQQVSKKHEPLKPLQEYAGILIFLWRCPCTDVCVQARPS